MAGNCGEIPGFSLMPEASFDDGMLDFEIIDTSGGLIGWANLFGDVVHQTITGKAQQSPPLHKFHHRADAGPQGRIASGETLTRTG
jgi:diacylglycerol kinase family enzyme